MAEIINYQMSQSKKTAFHVTKFQYHLNQTIPQIFAKNSSTKQSQNTQKILQIKRNHRNMVFYYANYSSEGIGNIDYQAIIQSAKLLYVTNDCLKLSQNSFKKHRTLKLPYFPVYGNFQEILQFHVIDNNSSASKIKSSRLKLSSRSAQIEISKIKQIQEQNPTKSAIQKLPSNNFELYVIHHCHLDTQDQTSPMKWQHVHQINIQFVQKYHFYDDNINLDNKSGKIQYSLIMNYEENQSYLSYFSQQHKLYELFINQYLKESQNGLENLQKLQGYLLLSKERINNKIKEMNDPSFDENHKRWLKLPTQFYKQYTSIKKNVMNHYKTLHQNKDAQNTHSEEFINNLICRYMHAKDYNHKETLQSIVQYLDWQKEYSSKFTLNYFSQMHEFDFFTYLGKDLEGRAVILNKAANLIVDKIIDVDKYCQYYLYYLEIWIARRLKGYCDQYVIIADLQGLGTQNFKMAITKRNVDDSLKYSPQRQYKLIVVNIGNFAKFLWTLIKPLLPKRTLSKLNLVGGEQKQILQALQKQMDISVIPEYLGGANKRTYKDDLKDDEEQQKLMKKK